MPTGSHPNPIPPVRGPAAIAMLCLRCVVVLAAVNGVVALVLGTVTGALGWGLVVVLLAALVACVPIALVGYPAGLLTAWLLRRSEREWVHVLVFAVVGAVLPPLVMTAWHSGVDTGAAAVAEGAIGAGGARWWSGRAHARAATRPARAPRPEPEDALVEAQLEDRTDR
ncbi:hypothetical protein [Cellulomonas sp. PhB150]|uniref:hypothetical protein n=1 Tax=Cellulomonas sp. PhB150 TaxID=2485188 RepID=UPI000FAD6194|nr:hypothetical protein [Cellulomonas sp. PhB150]ROS23187.1 hypothetical protein EDF34_3364 [Cellulomonas sp. PhB150]